MALYREKVDFLFTVYNNFYRATPQHNYAERNTDENIIMNIASDRRSVSSFVCLSVCLSHADVALKRTNRL